MFNVLIRVDESCHGPKKTSEVLNEPAGSVTPYGPNGHTAHSTGHRNRAAR